MLHNNLRFTGVTYVKYFIPFIAEYSVLWLSTMCLHSNALIEDIGLASTFSLQPLTP